MPLVRLRIPGKYWDSLLYNDRLFLVRRDGAVEILNWDCLIDSLTIQDPAHRATVKHLFARGRAWYALAIQDQIHEGALGTVLNEGIDALARTDLRASRHQLKDAHLATVQIDDFPTTDFEAYGNVLFAASTDGVVAAHLKRLDQIDLSRSSLITDTPALRVTASYGMLAIAGGVEGLFEVPVRHLDEYYSYWDAIPSRPEYISSTPAYSCNYIRFDLAASTPGEGGYVGAFTRPRAGTAEDRSYEGYDRQLLDTLDSKEIFDLEGGLLFGGGDRLMLATDKQYRSGGWDPYKRKKDVQLFDALDAIYSSPSQIDAPRRREPIDAALTVFGAVYEYEGSLVIAGTDGVQHLIRGEPVAWRVFPRSRRYLNQLHVIRNEYVDVFATSHDYFLRRDARGPSLPRPKASSW
jgi:hypothetical protein